MAAALGKILSSSKRKRAVTEVESEDKADLRRSARSNKAKKGDKE